MTKLFVVRHSISKQDPTLPPCQWGLTQGGLQAAERLADSSCWQEVTAIYTSPEPKALLTAEPIAKRWIIPLTVVEDLRELHMAEQWRGHEEHLRKVGDYLEGADDQDFEDYDCAQRRIVNCISRLLQAHPEQSIAVVSHARILTVYFSHLFGRRLGRQDWQAIRMPDMAVIDRSSGKVIEGFFNEESEDEGGQP